MSSGDGETSLRGNRVLVTGAAGGIGTAICTALAAAGARLVLAGRDEERLRAQAAQLHDDHGCAAAVLVADLVQGSIGEVASGALSIYEGLDTLVNNAGVSHPQRVVELSTPEWDDTMAVNLRAPALLSARVGAAMADSGTGGSIISVGSAAGITALAEHYAYSISKAALIMMTKMLALELGPAGVRANVICPTVVMTDMGQRVWGDAKKAAPLLSRVPLGHFAQPDDVSAAVVYLASPAAAMLNGVVLPIDGGYSVA